jgi:hypothetical protein
VRLIPFLVQNPSSSNEILKIWHKNKLCLQIFQNCYENSKKARPNGDQIENNWTLQKILTCFIQSILVKAPLD